MNLEQIYKHEELLNNFAENYCDTRNYPNVRTIIDRAMNLGITANEIDTLLAAAFNRGMQEA